MSFIKDMHVKKKPVTITYDPEEVQIEMDEYQRVHQQFVKNRPFPIKGDDRSIGFYPNIPNSPLSFRPKYPDVPYDDLQDRTYKGEPVASFLDIEHNIELVFCRSTNIGRL